GQWTRERVLRDCVRVIRMTRPLVVTSVFVGGPSDGHGNHQVAGQMAKEGFAAAGDPAIFPEQIQAGLRAWTPLKYYARAPFGRRGGGPALSIHVEVPAGDYDPLLGASYAQLAREGLGFQKSQNGGPSAPPAGRLSSAYHRFESRVSAAEKELTFFDGIDVSLAGIASLAGSEDAAFLKQALNSIHGAAESALSPFNGRNPSAIAPQLARGLRETNDLTGAVRASKLSPAAKYDILHELTIKSAQFNHALAAALGLAVSASVTAAGGSGDSA